MDRRQVRVVAQALGQSRVGEFGETFRVEQDVIGLHVAVDIIAGVQEIECTCDVDSNAYGDTDGKEPELRECGVGTGSVDEFQNEIMAGGFRVVARCIALNEIRMAQQATESGLTIEAVDE